MMLHLQRSFADNRQDQAMAGRGGKRSTSFKPGQSGSPHGRPKVAGEVQELARQHTGEAIETLVGIMRDKKAPPAARAMASNSILDRGHGKPAQTMNCNIKNDSLHAICNLLSYGCSEVWTASRI